MNLNDFCKVETPKAKEEKEWNLPTSENPKIVAKGVDTETSNEVFQEDNNGIPIYSKNCKELYFVTKTPKFCKICGKKLRD